MKSKMENFEDAFRTNHGSCRGKCVCGKEFYNQDGTWDWEPGELDALKAAGATNLEYSVGFVEFEGKEYAMDCDCWHPRAKTLMGFLDSHAHQVAKYLNGEKKRATARADAMPTVAE